MNKQNPKQASQPVPSGQQTCIWSILSIIFAFLFSILGIIFGIVALVQIRKNPQLKGKGLAIAGIIVGAIMMLLIPLLIFIGGIMYFGVLNPNILVPDRCTLETGLACRDFSATPTSLMLDIENGMGKAIVLSSIKAEQPDTMCEWSGSEEIANGGDTTFTLTGCNFMPTIASKAKIDLKISYYYADSSPVNAYEITGDILAGLEP